MGILGASALPIYCILSWVAVLRSESTGESERMPKQQDAMDASQVGKGNWAGFDVPLENIYKAAAEWRQALAGVTRPWLCWNVSDRWCGLQQRLIQEVGWTPVIRSQMWATYDSTTRFHRDRLQLPFRI